MNPATIKMLLDAAKTILGRVKEYNDKKAREAYDLLSDAAARVDVDDLRARGESLIDESRREAGHVTQAAHQRLDAARKRLAKVADQTPARKRAKQAARRRNWSMASLATLLVAAIGGAVYWFTRQQAAPGDTPPKVEDFSGAATTDTATESTLVYSTTTPEEGVPAERDEALLDSLDEQLDQYRSAEADDTEEDDAVDTDDPVNDESVDDVTDPDAEAGDKQ